MELNDLSLRISEIVPMVSMVSEMMVPKDVCILISGTCEDSHLPAKRALQMQFDEGSSDRESVLDYPGETNVVRRLLQVKEGDRRVRGREGGVTEIALRRGRGEATAGCEHDHEPSAAPTHGKGQSLTSFLVLPEGTALLSLCLLPL